MSTGALLDRIDGVRKELEKKAKEEYKDSGSYGFRNGYIKACSDFSHEIRHIISREFPR